MRSTSGWTGNTPACPFERYADDVVIHCDTEQQAQQLCADLAERLGSGGLELHPDKTKIVYCKDTKRRDEAEHTSFDFLAYTFRGRLARGRRGFFVSFSPAMSPKAKKAIGKQIRDWHLNRRSATDGQFHRSVHGSGHDDRCQYEHRPMEVPACQAYRWRCVSARRSSAL